jgi:capsule polysaccharide export protein KpsE/RkpR
MVDAAALVQGQLIASEAEMKGLQQLYTDDNRQVQTAKAQVAELRGQLEKLGGDDPTVPHPGAPKEMYPSIRKLPILGAEYLDLYRRMKIREATYEAFVTEVEMNKFTELDGGPKIQVLSPATVPEKISFPPRGILTVLGTLVWLGSACGWVLWTEAVDKMELGDPRRRLALQVITRIRRRGPAAVHLENSPATDNFESSKNTSEDQEAVLTSDGSER